MTKKIEFHTVSGQFTEEDLVNVLNLLDLVEDKTEEEELSIMRLRIVGALITWRREDDNV